jgi:(1->4)-alpha-D-glucan 1-alpha-D-glucosylmutase
MTIPGATYRLQFRESFGCRQAAAIAPYLRRLGVSHVYASPYFKARPGSSHGYDIVDHHALNPELGSEEDYVAHIPHRLCRNGDSLYHVSWKSILSRAD